MAEKTTAVAAGTAPVDGDQKYRIVGSVYYRPADFALARRYTQLADALADMGEGLVIADDGHVAAFHQRHERLVARTATPSAASDS